MADAAVIDVDAVLAADFVASTSEVKTLEEAKRNIGRWAMATAAKDRSEITPEEWERVEKGTARLDEINARIAEIERGLQLDRLSADGEATAKADRLADLEALKAAAGGGKFDEDAPAAARRKRREWLPFHKLAGYDAYDAWRKNIADGSGGLVGTSPTLKRDIGIIELKEIASVRTNVAGENRVTTPQAVDLGLIERMYQPERVALERLVTLHGELGSDHLTWDEQISRTNNADWITEADSCDDELVDPLARKPKSTWALMEHTDHVRQVAHMDCFTRKAVKFGTQAWQDLRDAEGRDGILDRVEEAFWTGTGAEDPLGLANLGGTQVLPSTGDMVRDIRIAQLLCRIVGGSRPTATVVNPLSAIELDLMTQADGTYLRGNPFFASLGTPSIFDMPIFESEHVLPGIGWTADWKKSHLWDFDGISEYTADSNGYDFEHNRLVKLWEMYVLLIFTRPAAFVQHTDLPTASI